jgi:hypothetical protein
MADNIVMTNIRDKIGSPPCVSCEERSGKQRKVKRMIANKCK